MRISFDLDDTLICYGPQTPREARPHWLWRWFTPREPLRAGARSLLQTLHRSGCELWVYTTSHRSPGAVRRWLRAYGIPVARVVNQTTHDRQVPCGPDGRRPSKNPAAFGIDLHVDDLDGVRLEGLTWGFDVLVIAPHDAGWTEKVLAAVAARCEELRPARPIV